MLFTAVTIDRSARTAKFDFTGTGSEIFGNTNAPRAVTYSAIIYSLRCLVGSDVPLNQGCLAPITIDIPEGTLLHPSAEAAVVGGNVLTSQRVVDVVLKAFGACAASQGCMNNLTMGDDHFGYYETIAGGAGAGPTWNGRSGVHTHMTNTRITDPEIFERRYPVILRKFSLRTGSGGSGKYRGGDGVVREIEFRKNLLVSILSERRSYHPYGLEGGAPGARGANTIIRIDGRKLNLGGKNTVAVVAGERLRIETPGGGGYGPSGKPWDADADEYAAALCNALGVTRDADSGDEGAVVATDSSGGAALSAAFLFSGSVGRYKETQESV
jgi:5-oxoprolinase (ATP-hydrolysing)